MLSLLVVETGETDRRTGETDRRTDKWTLISRLVKTVLTKILSTCSKVGEFGEIWSVVDYDPPGIIRTIFISKGY